MATEIRVPTLGESVTEATVGKWFKKAGDAIAADEPVVELETDKVTVEVPAPAGGVLAEIVVQEGETVGVGALLGSIAEGAGAQPAPAAKKEEPQAAAPKAVEPARPAAAAAPAAGQTDMPPSPSAARVLTEAGISADQVAGSGKRGQVLKTDALDAVARGVTALAAVPAPAAPRVASSQEDGAREERVRMTKLRQTIARRLKDAQNTAAMLTTFNEVDLGEVMEIRKRYRDSFEKKHGVRIGFMSFFVKAAIEALRKFPVVNASVEGSDIVYHDYFDIGVAVSTDRGLMVPVLRDADAMSFADIERNIGDFAGRARDGKIGVDDLSGGTFTITNGGVFGSLMSTPIINPPQSAILGMHKIQERPMVVNGEIKVRPMMYIALTYDHRIIDGREAVQFLVSIKESLEDPARLLIQL